MRYKIYLKLIALVILMGSLTVAQPVDAAVSPPTPTGVSASDGTASAGDLLVIWDNPTVSTPFDYYYIEIAYSTTEGGSKTVIWEHTCTIPCNIISPIVHNQLPINGYSYYIWLRFGYETGGTPNWGSYGQNSGWAKPNTPSNATASDDDLIKIRIDWGSVPNTATYHIYKATTQNGSYSELGSTSLTFYYDVAATKGTTYYYRVVACYNASRCSGMSAAAPGISPYVLAPTTLAASAISKTQINLTWVDNANNETGFRVERSATGTGGWAQLATPAVDATSYADTAASCDTTYYYRVYAKHANGDSSPSNIASATAVVCAPSAPTLLTATAAGETKINLTWVDNADNEISFRVERSATGTGAWVPLASLAANTESYADTISLTCGNTYYYRVFAKNDGGNNESSIKSATTDACDPPAVPTNVKATDGTSSKHVKVTWGSVAAATSYEVYRYSGTSWVKRTTTTNLVYKDTAATPLITYKYKVKACNANGCSAKSTVATGYRGKLVTTQLVRNLGFEIDTNNDGIPNFWTRASNNKLDKRICSPAAKRLGKCGYRFLGDSVAAKDWVRQNLSTKTINKGGGHNGDKLILSFYARSLRLELADGAYVLVKVRNSATNKQQVIRVNLTGTHAYKRFTKTLRVTIGNYNQVWVYVYANGTANENLYVDNVSVKLQYIQTK